MSGDKLSGKRILVVEDEMMIAMLLEDTLLDLGCIVLGPASGCAQALALVNGAADIDAGILDVNLGGERSFPVADVLRERRIPFMFATGYGSAGIPDAYAQHPVIIKPFDPVAVADALASILR